MRVTLVLCDFAQVAEGKLYLLGGGWNVKGAGTQMALGILVDVDWSETNKPHVWTVRLLDADGRPVSVPGPEGSIDLVVSGQVEVGRPPGLAEGTPQTVPLAVNFGPIPFPFGQRFTFVVEIDGRSEENWRVAFTTAVPPATG